MSRESEFDEFKRLKQEFWKLEREASKRARHLNIPCVLYDLYRDPDLTMRRLENATEWAQRF